MLDYELVDFGEGRKLERFGKLLLDRPCPAAERSTKANPRLWSSATAQYDGSRATDGQWSADDWQTDLTVDELGFTLRLAPLPSGQVGLFPEQLANWRWITQRVQKAGRPLRVLNLFAYTGGSTLAAAAAGAEVTHVDAARGIVARARENAELSGLADRPVRWIAEDAAKFCRRELKRQIFYDAVILDPPTYGHGPKGEEWRVKRDLLPLLSLCGELTAQHRAFVLCTCHTPGIGPAELTAYLADGLFGHCSQPPKTGKLFLRTPNARNLPSGVFARWPK